jgi:tetratricopeptide (TPR) repeat protein
MAQSKTGAVSRTAPFFFILSLTLLMGACGQKKNNQPDTSGDQALKVDSTNIGVLDGLIRENPKNPDLFARRARIYATKKNYTQALNDISIALRLDSLKAENYVSQAEYFIFSGEPNSAKKGLTTCLKKFPGNTDVMLKLAEIHLYMKEYGAAKLMLNDIKPINDDLAQIYFIQGLIALETNDSLGAVKNFQVTIEKDPAYYAAYMQAGKVYSAQSNDIAIQYFKSAIELEPVSYEAHYELGIYYQNHGYLDEAHQEYETISSQIDSTQPYPYYNRGYIEMVYKQNYSKAVEWFSKAISKKADYAEAWYNRGFSHELDGKLSNAREDYKKAMEIQPNFPLAIKGLNRIAEGKPIKIK